MNQAFQWIFPAVFHCSTHLLHEIPSRSLSDTVALTHLDTRKTLTGSTHLEDNAKDLFQSEFHFVEEGSGRRGLYFATTIVVVLMAFFLTSFVMTALRTGKSIVPFQFCQIGLDSLVIGKPFYKVQCIFAFEFHCCLFLQEPTYGFYAYNSGISIRHNVNNSNRTLTAVGGYTKPKSPKIKFLG